MDVWRLTVAVLRSWYILLPLLALTGVAALQAGAGVKPDYQATATVMLVPGQGESEVSNPYGSLGGTSEIVAIVLTSTETRARLEASGLSPEYEVSAGSRSTIIRFSALAATPEVAIATLDGLLQATQDELTTRQADAGVPLAAHYGLEVLQAPSISAVVADGKTRIMAVVGLLGAAVSFLLAILFDDLVGLIKRWRRRRADKRADKLAARELDAGEAANDEASPHGEESVAGVDSDTDDSAATASDEAGATDVDVDRLTRAGRDV